MNPTIQPNGDAVYTGSATTVAATPGTPLPTTIVTTATVDNAQTTIPNPIGNGSTIASTTDVAITPAVTTVPQATTTFSNTPTVTTNPNGSTTTVYAENVGVNNQGVAPFYSNPV